MGSSGLWTTLGAIGGPLLAIALVDLVGVRAAIGLSVIPGLLAALAIIYAIRNTAAARARTSQPIRIKIRPVLRGHLGRLMIGVSAFELGNAAACGVPKRGHRSLTCWFSCGSSRVAGSIAGL